MTKIFLSLGMHGRPEEDIRADIAKMSEEIKEYFEDTEIEIVHNFDCEAPKGAGRLYYLGNALIKMDGCNAIYLAKDWARHKGCTIEYDVAIKYGLDVFKQ